MQEPEAAAGDAAIAAMAWLSVKPAPSRVRPNWPSSPGQPATAARTGRAGRPAPGGGERGSAAIKIYFGNEIQDSEPNILTPN